MIKLFEKYNNIKEMKDLLFKKSVQTGEIKIVDFFLNKGYDINNEEALVQACYDPFVMFAHLVEKGINLEEFEDSWDFKRRLQNDLDLQKSIINLGKEQIIYDTVGFDSRLKYDPKYKDIIDRFEDAEKYNL